MLNTWAPKGQHGLSKDVAVQLLLFFFFWNNYVCTNMKISTLCCPKIQHFVLIFKQFFWMTKQTRLRYSFFLRKKVTWAPELSLATSRCVVKACEGGYVKLTAGGNWWISHDSPTAAIVTGQSLPVCEHRSWMGSGELAVSFSQQLGSPVANPPEWVRC